MPFVDFAELKTRVSIEQATQMLGLNLTPHGSQHRGPCPVCKTGGDRALVVTPAKGLFYCFAAKSGGDAIALVAHIRGISVKDAAWLQSRIPSLMSDMGGPPVVFGVRP